MWPSRSECPPAGVHLGPGAGGKGFTEVSCGQSWLKGGAGVRSHLGAGPSGSRLFSATPARVSSRASSSESLSAKTCSLFLPDYIQDKYLLQLLRSADDVSTWVAAEIVTSHTAKVGTSAAWSLGQGLGSDR